MTASVWLLPFHPAPLMYRRRRRHRAALTSPTVITYLVPSPLRKKTDPTKDANVDPCSPPGEQSPPSRGGNPGRDAAVFFRGACGGRPRPHRRRCSPRGVAPLLPSPWPPAPSPAPPLPPHRGVRGTGGGDGLGNDEAPAADVEAGAVASVASLSHGCKLDGNVGELRLPQWRPLTCPPSHREQNRQSRPRLAAATATKASAGGRCPWGEWSPP